MQSFALSTHTLGGVLGVRVRGSTGEMLGVSDDMVEGDTLGEVLGDVVGESDGNVLGGAEETLGKVLGGTVREVLGDALSFPDGNALNEVGE